MELNEEFVTRDEETGRSCLSYIPDKRLNRYSFLSIGDMADADLGFTQLLAAIVHHQETPCSCWLSWPHVQAGFTTRSRMWLIRYAKQGWNTIHDEHQAMAFKRITDAASFLRDYRPWRWGETALALVWSPGSSGAALMQSPFRTSWPQHSWGSPGPQALAWMSAAPVSLGFMRRDWNNRPAMVFVGPQRLDIAALCDQGLIAKILPGGQADALWRIPV